MGNYLVVSKIIPTFVTDLETIVLTTKNKQVL